MNYRADIDGLRAIAVLAVFIYHLGAAWLPGGFIGVDVFFVISGFLITGIIRKNIARNSFSFSSFFIKRIRRITPALLFMTICVAAAGYLLLKPAALVSLYKSAWTQPFALQNMHFLIEGEYFRGSELKPLLHTWSLGVEEQFYLLWPLLIYFTFRLSKSWVFTTLVVVLLGSFAMSMLLLPISPKASFFLFPTRAWELAAGGLLAIAIENRKQTNGSGIWQNLAALIGLCILGVGFFGISSAVAYPGWYAWIPVIGTLCLIWASTNTFVGSVLSIKPLVGIGLISYSLYLWHWPLIVFARTLHYDLHSAVVIFTIIGAAFCLAFLSYKLIEEPFRKKLFFKSQHKLIVCFSIVTASLVLVSSFAIKTQGFSFRFSEPAKSMLTASFNTDGDGRCGFVFRVLNPESVVCHTNGISQDLERGILLWGNSHAAMWLGVVNDLGRKYNRPVFLSARNCRPTIDSSFCGKTLQEKVLLSIKKHSISDVILASSWYGAYDIEDSRFESELAGIVGKLVDIDVNVWLVLDTPSGDKFNPIYQYEKSPSSPEVGVYPYDYFEDRFLREKRLFNKISALSSNIKILDPTVGICPEQKKCLGGLGGSIWYRDGGHLTTAGALTALQVFNTAFANDIEP